MEVTPKYEANNEIRIKDGKVPSPFSFNVSATYTRLLFDSLYNISIII